MFSKANHSKQRDTGASESSGEINKAVPSIVSADLAIEGNLISTGEVQVDGSVSGDIRCKALIVGVKGSVTGEVVAQTVRMHGSIKGMVRAKSVFLASTARMAGDVEHESLAIEPGAYLEGHCRRLSEANLASVVEPRREHHSVGRSDNLRLASPKPAIAAT